MGTMNELTAHPQWVDSLHGYVKPYWDGLLHGDWARGVASAQLTVPEMQGWILQIYPFIHAFPKFLAEALIKVEDDYSRSFLIDNIRVEMGPKTSKWFREHAHYDDVHPKIAMEIVKRYATTDRTQMRVMLAAKRSIQLLDQALEASHKAYTPADELPAPAADKRAAGRRSDRRAAAGFISFPDRRFGDRRGRARRAVH